MLITERKGPLRQSLMSGMSSTGRLETTRKLLDSLPVHLYHPVTMTNDNAQVTSTLRSEAKPATLSATKQPAKKTKKAKAAKSANLGGRAKPANEGQVKTGQRRVHSGH